LLDLLAEHSERSNAQILVAIETAKGLLPAALRAAGYQLFAINPLAVSRYRDRHVVSRAKSDPSDAQVLANILRTDLTAHRPIPADSELAARIRVLARASRTRSGIVSRPRTSSARCCASTTRPCGGI
jgi:transposase